MREYVNSLVQIRDGKEVYYRILSNIGREIMSSRRATYQQFITPVTLVDCISQTEWRDSGKSREEMITDITMCIREPLMNDSYSFNIKVHEDMFVNGHPAHSIEALCQDLVLRKISRTIKQIYYVHQGNRNSIIKHIITLLNENSKLWVLRLDVHHFYETIDRTHLMSTLKEKGRISAQTIRLLDKLFGAAPINSTTGLPRGLNVSAMLSEYYMKYFDIELKKFPGVYYYARYVDDIIVFCISKEARDAVNKFIEEELRKLSLTLNNEKTILWESASANEFVYLGYAFSKWGDDVKVTIAPEKLKKIKTRITRSFVRYAKDGKYDELLMRIKYLTGNFGLHQLSRMVPIRVGLYYNYKYISNLDCLDELQRYYEKIVNLKSGKLGGKLRLKMTYAQREKLNHYSFKFGFERRVRYGFTKDQLKMITSCWK